MEARRPSPRGCLHVIVRELRIREGNYKESRELEEGVSSGLAEGGVVEEHTVMTEWRNAPLHDK